MNYLMLAYAIYLPLAIGLTIYVSRSLFKNGLVFMMDIFGGREGIAIATNKLFEVGFYLLNVGFALLILQIDANSAFDSQAMVEVLSRKVGGFALYLGFMLFVNLYLFFRGKRKARENRLAAQA